MCTKYIFLFVPLVVYALSPLLHAQPLLEVHSWQWYQKGRYNVLVEGEVHNLSNRTLGYVQALVSWYDANDRFITSSRSYLDLKQLLPGQTSPFSVWADYNPAMKTARLRFIMGGRELAVLFPPKKRLSVKEAQQILKECGYDPGPIDGVMGLKTRGALREYLRWNSLPVTGNLDTATQRALQEEKR